jgi:catechol 2,3-dioxygenase-like lactoylglutathione lyase family enzyme
LSRAVNHIAISVTDIKLAMSWYRDVMGMKVLAEPTLISTQEPASDAHLAMLVKEVFGPRLGKFMICHMIAANGPGIELFQFIEPRAVRRDDNFEYWKTGFFHLAITEPDVEGLASMIASTGVKRRTKVLEVAPGKRICFCEDPFGNVIEIYSHSYEQFWSDAGSPGGSKKP